MGKKRDYIEEIFEKRERAATLGKWSYTSLNFLSRSIPELDAADGNWLNYVPVKIVTMIEVFFQEVVKELVDSGEPYSTNIFKSIEVSKFDAALLKALHGRKITMGELTSHLLALNRIEEIIGLMDRLMDLKFKDRISTITDRWEIEINKKASVPIIDDIEGNIKTLEELIRVRHTVVHELTDISVSAKEALLYINEAHKFLSATNELVTETLYPNAPLTQTAMNIAAGQDYQASKSSLRLFVARLAKDLRAGYTDPDRVRSLLKAMRTWEIFVDQLATFESESVQGGTMQSQVYAMAAEGLTNNMLKYFEARFTAQYRENI
ncbi:hypothetical protein DYBT9623_05477 [Dyadobacter sp. CECT 9623]|uniref:Cthe-2314-like HEPN domain-containing protein n=1 Tax=Dyadobacter linearis TaxID=2823330 RepID=A0ABM8UYN9_9BACT|nr:HEPN domain-containing protein [Dyadobacter sp. CECT 9623]CAG5074789.1 hypothetical protein DYBT9623_05477 [Dyadobacter sp. CECT 9623]